MNSKRLVMAVIEAISHAEGTTPANLGYSLYDYVDPDIFSTLATGMSTDWEFSFEVPDHMVKVTSDGRILIDGVRFVVDNSSSAEPKNWNEDHQ